MMTIETFLSIVNFKIWRTNDFFISNVTELRQSMIRLKFDWTACDVQFLISINHAENFSWKIQCKYENICKCVYSNKICIFELFLRQQMINLSKFQINLKFHIFISKIVNVIDFVKCEKSKINRQHCSNVQIYEWRFWKRKKR